MQARTAVQHAGQHVYWCTCCTHKKGAAAGKKVAAAEKKMLLTKKKKDAFAGGKKQRSFLIFHVLFFRLRPLFLPKTDGSILEDIHPADPQQVFKILSEHKIVLGEFSAAHVVINVAEHQTYPPNFLPLSIVVIKS